MNNFLKGWDYIVAIEQKQLNTGLKQLYRKGQLIHECHAELDTFFGKAELQCNIDEPNINAIKDGLKICQLSMKVSNVVINNMKMDDFQLNIQAALTCIEAHIKNSHDKHYEVYIDFKDENAVYNVVLDSSSMNTNVQFLETVLKQKFQQLNHNAYKVTEFTLKKDNLKNFIPKLVDFSFVLNTEKPSRSPFLLCCSLDDQGPKVENRLTFTSDIITDNNPTCFWFNHKFIYKLIAEELEKQLKKMNGAAQLVCSDSGVQLKNGFKIAKVAASNVNLESVNIYPKNNKIYIDIQILVEGLAKSKSSIIIDFKQENNQLKINIKMTEPDISSIVSKTGRILTGIVTLGISEGVIAAIKDIVGKLVNAQLKSKIGNKLDKITSIIEELNKIQDKEFSGHLNIHNAFINSDGDVCAEVNAIVKK